MNNKRKFDHEDSQGYAHRRKVDADAVLHLHSRVADCEESIKKMLDSQREVAESLKVLTSNLGRVAEVMEAWNNAKGFWLTIKIFSAGAKIILPLIALVAGIWFFLKTGKWMGIDE